MYIGQRVIVSNPRNLDRASASLCEGTVFTVSPHGWIGVMFDAGYRRCYFPERVDVDKHVTVGDAVGLGA